MPEYQTENRGVLFPNRYKEEGDNKPDYTGKVDVNGEEWRLAAWENTSKKGNSYLSVAVSEPRVDGEDEKVPF